MTKDFISISLYVRLKRPTSRYTCATLRYWRKFEDPRTLDLRKFLQMLKDEKTYDDFVADILRCYSDYAEAELRQHNLARGFGEKAKKAKMLKAGGGGASSKDASGTAVKKDGAKPKAKAKGRPKKKAGGKKNMLEEDDLLDSDEEEEEGVSSDKNDESSDEEEREKREKLLDPILKAYKLKKKDDDDEDDDKFGGGGGAASSSSAKPMKAAAKSAPKSGGAKSGKNSAHNSKKNAESFSSSSSLPNFGTTASLLPSSLQNAHSSHLPIVHASLHNPPSLSIFLLDQKNPPIRNKNSSSQLLPPPPPARYAKNVDFTQIALPRGWEVRPDPNGQGNFRFLAVQSWNPQTSEIIQKEMPTFRAWQCALVRAGHGHINFNDYCRRSPVEESESEQRGSGDSAGSGESHYQQEENSSEADSNNSLDNEMRDNEMLDNSPEMLDEHQMDCPPGSEKIDEERAEGALADEAVDEEELHTPTSDSKASTLVPTSDANATSALAGGDETEKAIPTPKIADQTENNALTLPVPSIGAARSSVEAGFWTKSEEQRGAEDAASTTAVSKQRGAEDAGVVLESAAHPSSCSRLLSEDPCFSTSAGEITSPPGLPKPASAASRETTSLPGASSSGTKKLWENSDEISPASSGSGRGLPNIPDSPTSSDDDDRPSKLERLAEKLCPPQQNVGTTAERVPAPAARGRTDLKTIGGITLDADETTVELFETEVRRAGGAYRKSVQDVTPLGKDGSMRKPPGGGGEDGPNGGSSSFGRGGSSSFGSAGARSQALGGGSSRAGSSAGGSAKGGPAGSETAGEQSCSPCSSLGHRDSVHDSCNGNEETLSTQKFHQVQLLNPEDRISEIASCALATIDDRFSGSGGRMER